MTNVLNARGVWRVLLIVATVCSFSTVQSFNCQTMFSSYGWVWTILLPLGMGVFSWLVFEILVGFWQAGIKDTIPRNIDNADFLNLSRFFVIFLNILIFLFYKIILLINFFPNYMTLVANLVLTFLYILTIWLVLEKVIFKGVTLNKKFDLLFFCFGFLYLFMRTILWGVL